MLVNNKNYQEVLKKETEKNIILIEKLNSLLSSLTGVFNIASVGNSIASGYSKCDEMLPLLTRTRLGTSSEKIKVYTYARVRKNEDYNILKWITENISHTQINEMLIQDILEKKGKYANFGPKQLKAYREMQAQSNIGLKDFIKLNNNIIIYNGLTGTFTDIVRKGNAKDRMSLLKCFQMDYEYLKMVLTQIYLENPRVQVYLCGIPDILELGLSNLFDKYLIEVAKKFPNVIYLPGVSRNLLAKFANQKETDIHYSCPEYLMLLNNILNCLIKNYGNLALKNEILSGLKELNQNISSVDVRVKAGPEEIKRVLSSAIEKYGKYAIEEQKILSSVQRYYNDHYLTDFYCTDRASVNIELKQKRH